MNIIASRHDRFNHARQEKSPLVDSPEQSNKNLIFSCLIAPAPFLFWLDTLYTQVMLILILIDVQYLQNIACGFEKGSNGQNHSSSGSHHLIKKSFKQNSPLPLL